MSSPTHRNHPPAMTADTSDYESPWACLLQPDVVRLIGWRVLASDLLDYVRFRATCQHWRSSTVSPRGSGIVDPLFHPRRWMLLPQGHGLHPGNGVLRFFNLSRGIFVRTRLPLLTDHRVLDSLDGVLLLQHNRDDDVPIRVLNPLTGDTAELPARTPSVEIYFDSLINNQEHAASLSVSADGVAMVAVALFSLSTIIFATTRDRRWSVATWNPRYMGVPSVSFQGKIYALRSSAEVGTYKRTVQIFQIEPQLMRIGPSYPKLIASCTIGGIDDSFDLVECDSEILLIHTKYSATSPEFLVYKLADLILGKLVPVTSIGGNVLFVDVARRQSVSSRAMLGNGITGDAVVYLVPSYGRPQQYQIGSGTWSDVAGDVSDGGTVSRTYSLVDHMYNCCDCARSSR
ncbi:uncharacterized protein [Triticum aestivum]|uniref:uncharacterized protein n=1 Tax=Triticum aestivum TaxID=4565 RepID=UPI001D00E013|nr:uncharacterized protein LOC123041983 [Triticum aestivum]